MGNLISNDRLASYSELTGFEHPISNMKLPIRVFFINLIVLYEKGILPRIQIHDELDLSIKDDKEANKVIEIMENAVTLEVPNKVDYEQGETWGDIYD